MRNFDRFIDSLTKEETEHLLGELIEQAADEVIIRVLTQKLSDLMKAELAAQWE